MMSAIKIKYDKKRNEYEYKILGSILFSPWLFAIFFFKLDATPIFVSFYVAPLV